MKTRFVATLTLFILLVYPSISFSQEGKEIELSLNEAMDLALKNSSGIMAARQQIEISEAKLRQMNSMFLPKITFSETLLRSNDQVAVFGSKLRQGVFGMADFDITALNHPNSVTNLESKFTAQMPIFTSFMNSNMRKSAKKGLEASKHMTKYQESTLKMHIAKVYYGILSSEESLSHIDEGISQLKKLEKSYKLMRAPNSATTTSYLMSQATRFALEQNSQKADTNLQTLTSTLKSMLELDDNTNLVLTDIIPEAAALKKDSKDEKTTRADIKGITLNLNAVKLQKNSIYSMFGPRVDFFAGWAYNHPWWDDGEGAYQAGLVLTLNIFDHSRYGKLQEVKALEKQVDYFLKENIKNNKTAIEKAKKTLKGKIRELELSNISFGKADEALQFANQRYREGTLPLKDLSMAIAKWVEAKVNVAQTKYDLVSTKIDLDFERGEL